jgi:hypothetical protein
MTDETTATPSATVQQCVSRITFVELSQSVRSVLETGRLGTPVNVRLHWEFSDQECDIPAVLAAAVAIADEALQLEQPTWRVRRHATGRTLNVLGTDQRGRTLLITLVARSEPRTAMTMFGNHGIVRFEDGWVDPDSIPDSLVDHNWFPGLQAALQD